MSEKVLLPKDLVEEIRVFLQGLGHRGYNGSQPQTEEARKWDNYITETYANPAYKLHERLFAELSKELRMTPPERSAQDEIDGRLDIIFDRVDKFLVKGKLKECDAWLVEQLGLLGPKDELVLWIGLLAAPFPARHQLPSYRTLWQKVWDEAVRRHGEGKAKELLAGFGG